VLGACLSAYSFGFGGAGMVLVVRYSGLLVGDAHVPLRMPSRSPHKQVAPAR
jgi:hypothetical protein